VTNCSPAVGARKTALEFRARLAPRIWASFIQVAEEDARVTLIRWKLEFALDTAACRTWLDEHRVGGFLRTKPGLNSVTQVGDVAPARTATSTRSWWGA